MCLGVLLAPDDLSGIKSFCTLVLCLPLFLPNARVALGRGQHAKRLEA